MHRYSVEDDLRNGYKYTIGVCTTAVPSSEAEDKFKTAGAIQVHKQQVNSKPDDMEMHIIGSFEQAEIMSGSMLHKHFFFSLPSAFAVGSTCLSVHLFSILTFEPGDL